MSDPVTLLVGLDAAEVRDLRPRLSGPVVAAEMLPRVRLVDGELTVEDRDQWGHWPAVGRVVFHGLFEFDDDVRFSSALALWGGPCLPAAAAMLLARPRVPNLAISRRASRFASLPRTFLPAGGEYDAQRPTVAKWGEWHCGEGKELFTGRRHFDGPTLLEPFVAGEAVRVQVIGGEAWQLRMGGDDWKKSVHHPAAGLVPADPELVADVRRVTAAFGLAHGAADYVVEPDGTRHLLEFNHIPDVTAFPAIRAAYLDHVAGWTAASGTGG